MGYRQRDDERNQKVIDRPRASEHQHEKMFGRLREENLEVPKSSIPNPISRGPKTCQYDEPGNLLLPLPDIGSLDGMQITGNQNKGWDGERQ